MSTADRRLWLHTAGLLGTLAVAAVALALAFGAMVA